MYPILLISKLFIKLQMVSHLRSAKEAHNLVVGGGCGQLRVGSKEKPRYLLETVIRVESLSSSDDIYKTITALMQVL